jgi:hypothetical protein
MPTVHSSTRSVITPACNNSSNSSSRSRRKTDSWHCAASKQPAVPRRGENAQGVPLHRAGLQTRLTRHLV